MNTRIQVEHPVTEMVTGRDLVAMQIRLAGGVQEPIAQSDIACRGHAIECRLYAENPAKMFMPSPGKLERFAPPAASNHLRIDSGYRQGDSVTPFYDPMLAKVVTWDENRAQACERAAAALRAFDVDGLQCNRNFLIACLMDDAFARGDLHTGFIDARKAALIAA